MKWSVFPSGNPTSMTSVQFENYCKEAHLKTMEEKKNTETIITKSI